MGWAVLIPVVGIAAGVIIVVMSMWHQMRMREMVMRERIALVERGLVPSPETDPARFEALMGRPVRTSTYSAKVNERASRYRTGGILFVGFGIALMMIIGFAGNDPRSAFGVGGAFIAVGAALIVNSLFVAPPGSEPPPPAVPPLPPVEPSPAEGHPQPGSNTL